MRDQTEWINLIEGGFNVLTGAENTKIVDSVNIMLTKENDFNIDLYGNGIAAQNIVKSLLAYK